MSWKIRRILVAIGDPRHVPPGQLRKAAQLAAASGAQIELFHALHPGVAGVVAEMRARMTRLASRKLLRGLDVRSCLAIDSPPHEAIVRRAGLIRADLVIAATSAHRPGARLLLRNTDWELIRHTPCPVRFVKQGGGYRRPAIVAAVDPMHARAKPARLDARLLASASQLALWLQGSAHAFHAYLPLVAALPGAMGQPVALALPPEAEGIHGANVRRSFERLVAGSGIPRAPPPRNGRRAVAARRGRAAHARARRRNGSRVALGPAAPLHRQHGGTPARPAALRHPRGQAAGPGNFSCRQLRPRCRTPTTAPRASG